MDSFTLTLADHEESSPEAVAHLRKVAVTRERLAAGQDPTTGKPWTRNIPAVGTEVTIKGITYVVEQVDDKEAHLAAGRPNTAARMDRNGLAASVVLRRPRGRKHHMAWLRKDGRWTALVSV